MRLGSFSRRDEEDKAKLIEDSIRSSFLFFYGPFKKEFPLLCPPRTSFPVEELEQGLLIARTLSRVYPGFSHALNARGDFRRAMFQAAHRRDLPDVL